MTGIVAGMGAKAALSGAGAFLGRISPRTWLVIGCAVALAVGFLWHQHAAHKAVSDAYASGKHDQKASDDAAYAKLLADEKQKDAELADMAAQLRKANDEAHNAIAADAGDLSLRGPGAATCASVSSAPAASGGSVKAPAETGTPVAPVPDPGGQPLVALPYAPTVKLFEQHDECLADRKAIDAWYDALVKAWPKQPAN